MYKVKRFSRAVSNLISNNKNFLKRNIPKTLDEISKSGDKAGELAREINNRVKSGAMSKSQASKRISLIRGAANKRSDKLIDSLKGYKDAPSKIGTRVNNYLKSTIN